MAPQLKQSDKESPVNGRHRPPQPHPHPRSIPNRSPVLPPRADKGHPPRPPSHKTNSMRSHPQQLQSNSGSDDLRHAYRAQHIQSKSATKISHHHPSQDNNNNNSARHFDDHCSMSSMSAANSGATPSSVYMPSVPLSRDVSDLSGLSGGTRASSVPGQIYDPKSFQQPWRQAYCLSLQPPPVKAKGKDDVNNANSSADEGDENNKKSPSIWVAQTDVVEIFDNLQAALGLNQFQMVGHNRIPIMILLMDPHRHCYELMQIWVDRAMDSIRDLMQAMQQKLSSDQQQHQHHSNPSNHHQQQQHSKQWKQAYDGIFQVRGRRFTQLINIIRLVKYDVQPYEILVAKPWGMTAKVT